jgi:peptidoglycan/LPS O-acetylase OafA/YrhL
MKRIASLDLLRGLAAFAVAIPHYLTLNSTEWRAADIFAITAVEIFFVLSGFVLAPQILTHVVGNPADHLRIFLVRRWMRTIPPFLVALFCVSYITGQFWTADFVRYSVYVQNLLFQANTNDYYPIAWSLSVEEWYYVTFAPLLFIIAKFFKNFDRRFAALYAVCFILAIVVIRACWSDYNHWDAEVRRVTVFRIDSIAFGFLLYLAFEKLGYFQTPRPFSRGIVRWALLFVACSIAGGSVAYLTTIDNSLSMHAFPYAAAAVGLSAVALFRNAESLFAGRKVLSDFGDYLGRISYTVYLFHIILAIILKPKLASLDMTWQMLIYISCLVVVCSIFWHFFEKTILAARPKYSFYSHLDGGTAQALKA